MANVFFESGFDSGKWAGALAKLLRRTVIVPEYTPKARVWRATWKQWIQFEAARFYGPAFWLGKPAVLSEDGMLYCGYYVERGLQEHQSHPEYLIRAEWHWHGWCKCMVDAKRRTVLHSLMKDLPEDARRIWIRGDNSTISLEYKDEETFSDVIRSVRQIPADEWIDVIMGVCFTKEQCMALQEGIVSELSLPIIRAHEIELLVREGI